VIAVERDPKLAARPRRRFGDELLVRVVEADLRVRVFVSSTLTELAAERQAVWDAVTRLRLVPVMFELGGQVPRVA
jgi:hypothetical protein